jgi:hypothetical protein
MQRAGHINYVRSKTDDGRVCMAPNCVREQYARGMCWSCYNRTRIMVLKGIVTWKELEEADVAVPVVPQAKRRNPRSKVNFKRLPRWMLGLARNGSMFAPVRRGKK